VHKTRKHRGHGHHGHHGGHSVASMLRRPGSEGEHGGLKAPLIGAHAEDEHL